ncbi:hypothetical protein [Variovorax sp. dw_308]|uniref:hypothetical protein n=1 Tax=Variovorax sp. dw_308 TaxID=2721546 RepID=UPI001C460119|nr:hypothetical protein [Variovorax sp. dw_308]
MSYLLRDGRLSMVPIYDDVVYLIDGLSRLAVLDRQGIVRCLFDYVYAHPPHAPLVALTSLLGLLLSAGAPWGPYMLSAGWIVLVLLLGWVALRHANQWTRIGILVAALAMPMFGFVLTEFRPDPVWGLLVGFAVIVSASADVIWARPAKLVALGLLFGTAIVSKPTATLASMMVLAVAWIAQIGVSLLTMQAWNIGRAARASGWVTLGAACIVVPYLAINGAAILGYIREVMGSESMWRTQASALGHLTYYLNRATGTLVLGWAWYAALPLFAICAAVIVRFRDSRALPAFAAVMAAAVTAYLIATLSPVKSLMIGSILYGTVVAAVVWSLGYLTTRIPFRGRVVLVFGAVVFATQWVPRTGQVHREDPLMLAADTANRAVLPALTDILRATPNAVVLVTVPGPTYAGTLDFLSRQQGLVRTFMSGYTSDSWERVQQNASSADVIVLSEVGMVGQSLGYSFPSLKYQTRLLDELRTGGDFTGRPAFTDAKNRSVWLFVRNRK